MTKDYDVWTLGQVRPCPPVVPVPHWAGRSGARCPVGKVACVTAPPGVSAALTVGFDLDLTLVDSQERIISAYIRALADLGVEVSSEQLAPHLGIPLAHTAAAVGATVDADALVLRYRHY